MLGMHEQAYKIVAIGLETEKHSDSHIVYTALHGTVHCLGVVGVVALRACGVQGLVVLLVICLLEKDICTNAGITQATVVLYGCRRDVHIHTTYGSVPVLYAVDGTDALKDILNGVLQRMFTCLKGEALVSHILQGNHLGTDFVLGQFLATYALVLCVIRAIDTAIDAVVGEIQRREHNYAVAIEAVLYLICQGIYLLHYSGIVALKQQSRLAMGYALAGTRLVEYTVDEFKVTAVLTSILHCRVYLTITDELRCYCRFRIVHITFFFQIHFVFT